MRAVVHDKYGLPEVLRLEGIAQPVPKEDEVLVKIHATTVNRTDCGFRRGKPFIVRFFSGLIRPKKSIHGYELAGEVEAVGVAVTQFEVGDHVFGLKAGAHAEFICIRESGALAHKPTNMTFEQAAAVCDGAIMALTFLRRADLRAGQKILIYGASGSIGTAAVQLAKYFDAHVTAVSNTSNVEIVRSLGADEVIDYTQEDFTKNGQTYDVIFDAVGKHSFRRCRRSLKPGGIHFATDGWGNPSHSQPQRVPGGIYLSSDGWGNLVLALLPRRIGSKKVLFPLPRYTKKDVLFLKELIEAGKYRAVIDRRYPLEDVVEATRYVETEQKTGNVVLTVSRDRAQLPANRREEVNR